MTPEFISPDIESQLDWLELIAALEQGHSAPRAEIADSFLYRGTDTLLSRAAWIDGMGALVKTATIFPGNPEKGRASVNGAVSLFSDATGQIEAMVDFHLVTKWKTAGDSLLAASKLARRDSQRITLVGAGTVARSMHAAYRALFPDAEFTIWNRSAPAAETFARTMPQTRVATDLKEAVRKADIICTATMATEPLIRGEWLQPGQHLDLVGAFRPDMREVDDAALRRGHIFVDSRETTLAHIGELKIPLSQGVLSQEDIRADFYDLGSGKFTRPDPESITIAKNGGGAHLDLMTSRYIFLKWRSRK
jgi:ornithine cyclodeaminase